jgi:hypothetical protein
MSQMENSAVLYNADLPRLVSPQACYHTSSLQIRITKPRFTPDTQSLVFIPCLCYLSYPSLCLPVSLNQSNRTPHAKKKKAK